MSPVVVITSASAGVGRATAIRFARKGYDARQLERPAPLRLDASAAVSPTTATRAIMQETGHTIICVRKSGAFVSCHQTATCER